MAGFDDIPGFFADLFEGLTAPQYSKEQKRIMRLQGDSAALSLEDQRRRQALVGPQEDAQGNLTGPTVDALNMIMGNAQNVGGRSRQRVQARPFNPFGEMRDVQTFGAQYGPPAEPQSFQAPPPTLEDPVPPSGPEPTYGGTFSGEGAPAPFPVTFPIYGQTFQGENMLTTGQDWNTGEVIAAAEQTGEEILRERYPYMFENTQKQLDPGGGAGRDAFGQVYDPGDWASTGSVDPSQAQDNSTLDEAVSSSAYGGVYHPEVPRGLTQAEILKIMSSQFNKQAGQYGRHGGGGANWIDDYRNETDPYQAILDNQDPERGIDAFREWLFRNDMDETYYTPSANDRKIGVHSHPGLIEAFAKGGPQAADFWLARNMRGNEGSASGTSRLPSEFELDPSLFG